MYDFPLLHIFLMTAKKTKKKVAYHFVMISRMETEINLERSQEQKKEKSTSPLQFSGSLEACLSYRKGGRGRTTGAFSMQAV